VWISPLVIVGAPAFAGSLLQRSRSQTEEVRRLAGELERERRRHAEAAATAERHRIARELHDVISHSVSVMVVQAGAAEQVLPEGPARSQVHAIRETGKEALAELRRQLGLLRDGVADPVSPLPGLAELPALVATSGGRLTVTGLDGPLPAGLELAAYRIVQEALTNAARHAHGSAPEVAVTRAGDRLELAVTDSGGRSQGGGTGHGLMGMRERVAAYGGQVTAGPAPEGPGWQVRAWLPIPVAP
jgi:signal transduction histidine kinase